MLIVSILTGNLLGILSGEWKGTTRESKRLMASGVAVLLVAIGILAFASSLFKTPKTASVVNITAAIARG
jgi:hypothetical protein